MPSVEDVLRQSGFTDSEISQLDQRATIAFNNVLQQAQSEREKAELQKQSVDEFWTNTYNPGVAAWDAERTEAARKLADAEARAAFYQSREEILRAQGLISDDAPTFSTPQRDQKGRFVPGENGSPVFTPEEIVSRAATGLAAIADVDYRHRALFNQPMPITPSELIKQADAQGISPSEFAERKFGFSKREAEIQAQRAREHDDAIRAEVAAAKDREWSERTGSNPDVRLGVPSRIGDLQRKASAREVPDPLMMNESQRRAQTAKMVKDALAELHGA